MVDLERVQRRNNWVSWDSSTCKRDEVGICKAVRGREGTTANCLLFYPPEELGSAHKTSWSQV